MYVMYIVCVYVCLCIGIYTVFLFLIFPSGQLSFGLDGLGIESRWRRDFPHLPRPALGPTQPHVQWAPVFCPGVKAARS